MGLRTKLNLVLLFAAILGALVFAGVSTPFLEGLAREEVLQKSKIMMEAAAGARAYTSERVAPIALAATDGTFHPEAVSAFAAVKSFSVLHGKFPDYTYREVALNPTNLDDRPADWEADIVQYFRNNPGSTETINQRKTFRGEVLSLSRPIAVKPACLVCHSTPAAAPKAMLAQYGSEHGFGWKQGEVVGAQIVSVPMKVAYERASQTRLLFIALFLGVFAFLAVVLNLALGFVVIRPVLTLAKIAEDVSMGRDDAPEFTVAGDDQIAKLTASFNRMRRSIRESLRLLSERR